MDLDRSMIIQNILDSKKDNDSDDDSSDSDSENDDDVEGNDFFYLNLLN